jgi:HD-like signal output (HDOD) protein
MFGFAGKIDSVSRAVSLLGTDQLSSLALGVTVVHQFAEIPSELLNMDSFWRHSIRCGLFAKHLAEQLGVAGAENYFTGGLLHDIGRLIMLDRCPDQYRQAIARGRREQLPMFRAEQDCLQTDHSMVGKLLVMRWRLPAPLLRMIGGHHSPGMNHYALESSLMHIADLLAHAFGTEVNLVNEVPPLQEKAWQATGLSADALAPVIRRVDGEFAGIVRVFFGGTDEART